MIVRALRVAVVTMPLALQLSCMSAKHAGPSSTVDRSVITEEQIYAQHYQNLLDVVQSLRSNWLLTRGTDSFVAPSQVWVYLDNMRYGGVQSLASLSPYGVVSITRFSGVEATARWGIGHSAGVIQVATWPSGAAPDSSTGVGVTADTSSAAPHR